MSITDELRKVAAKTECANGRCEKLYRGDLDHIADRIDAEHEAMLVDARKTVYQGYIELPKDADGWYIHIGDVMVSKDGKVHRVDSLTRNPTWFDYEWSIRLALLNDGVGAGSLVRYRPDTLRHYHTPTVEDVLREMLDAWGELPSNATNEAIVAEYAAKLRLAGDAE